MLHQLLFINWIEFLFFLCSYSLSLESSSAPRVLSHILLFLPREDSYLWRALKPCHGSSLFWESRRTTTSFGTATREPRRASRRCMRVVLDYLVGLNEINWFSFMFVRSLTNNKWLRGLSSCTWDAAALLAADDGDALPLAGWCGCSSLRSARTEIFFHATIQRVDNLQRYLLRGDFVLLWAVS